MRNLCNPLCRVQRRCPSDHDQIAQRHGLSRASVAMGGPARPRHVELNKLGQGAVCARHGTRAGEDSSGHLLKGRSPVRCVGGASEDEHIDKSGERKGEGVRAMQILFCLDCQGESPIVPASLAWPILLLTIFQFRNSQPCLGLGLCGPLLKNKSTILRHEHSD